MQRRVANWAACVDVHREQNDLRATLDPAIFVPRYISETISNGLRSSTMTMEKRESYCLYEDKLMLNAV